MPSYASAMRIVSVNCRQDNYAYLLVCEETNEVVAIDPSEPEPVLAALIAEKFTLREVWNTHHHYDHVGGNEALAARYPGIDIVAHESDRGRVPGQTRFVKEGDTLEVGKEISAKVLFNPGHTTGAISFYLSEREAVFTGDTLFGAGCGRLFEGSASEMYQSLMGLVGLPESTKVYCGHEYTAANLAFALAVESGNSATAQRAERVGELRGKGESTMGFTIAEELATNVFVRCEKTDVVASAREQGIRSENPEDVFTALRAWKDNF